MLLQVFISNSWEREVKLELIELNLYAVSNVAVGVYLLFLLKQQDFYFFVDHKLDWRKIFYKESNAFLLEAIIWRKIWTLQLSRNSWLF